MVDINEAGGKATVEEITKKGGKAIFVRGDVTSEADVSLYFRRRRILFAYGMYLDGSGRMRSPRRSARSARSTSSSTMVSAEP